MQLILQVLFSALLAFAIWLFAKNIIQIRRNIFLGKPQDISDNKPQRWRNLIFMQVLSSLI